MGFGSVSDVFGFGLGVGFGFFFGDASGFDVFSAVELVHGADDDEDNKSDEKKVDDVLEEVAVGDMSDGVGAEEVRNIESEARKVETAGEEAGNWHDDVVDERFDDSGEGTTDGDTDSEIDDATAVDKFFEFLDEIAFGDAGDNSARRRAGDGGTMLGSVRGGCLWG